MDLGLDDKRALVTGSTSGIGEAIATALAREGVKVIIHGRREGEALRVLSAIQATGGTAAVALGDLGSDDGAARVADAAMEAFGGVDIVVNNVGIANDDSWETPDTAEWAAAYNTNVLSSTRVIGRLLPQMKARGWGRFIQIASIAAHAPQSNYTSYGAAKAAVVNLTVSLANSIASTGVTSNVLSPGVILSDEIDAWMTQLANEKGWTGDRREIERQFTADFMPNIVCRLGRADEIADFVVYLASARADYITGAHFTADGGHLG